MSVQSKLVLVWVQTPSTVVCVGCGREYGYNDHRSVSTSDRQWSHENTRYWYGRLTQVQPVVGRSPYLGESGDKNGFIKFSLDAQYVIGLALMVSDRH